MPTITQFRSWQDLTAHAEATRDLHLRDLFAADPQRGERLNAEGAGLYLDYSKNRVTDETLAKLEANIRAMRETWLRSPIRAFPAPGYWILTATSRPSCHLARCTWPIDAAAAGMSSNSEKRESQSSPSPSAMQARTVVAGIGGAAS